MRWLRVRDRQAREADLRPESLVGSWCNTHTEPQGLSRLDVAVESSRPALRLWGPEGQVLESWTSDLTLYCGISSPDVVAFSSRCGFGGYEAFLQGNLNLGLLVLGAYKTFPEGNGYFSREFFARRPLAAEPPDGPADRGAPRHLFAGVREPVEVSAEAMAGRWLNTDPQSPGIAEIVIESHGGELSVQVFGKGGDGSGEDGLVDWGKAAVGVYATIDELGVKTFSVLASYDLGYMVSHLQVRLPGGALAIADFSSFSGDSGRANYCTREFYHRA